MEYYPTFDKTSSFLREITILDCVIRFEDNLDMYNKLTNLIKLDMSSNNLSIIPQEVTKIPFLEILLLKRNFLKELPSSLGEMQHLKHLDLTDNQLSSLPKFRNDSKVEVINLNKNKFEKFEGIITNSENNLTFLYFVNNFFKEIPRDILKMKRLRHLALDFNKISEIPEWITQFTKIPDWGYGEPDFELKISLSNQEQKIQNKDSYTSSFESKNEVLTISKDMDNTAPAINKKTPRELKVPNVEEKPAEEVKTFEKSTIDYFPDAKHSHEININKEINQKLKENKLLDKEAKDKMVRKEVMKYLYKKIIKLEQESEISKFSDTKLKFIIKKCYQVIHKYNHDKYDNRQDTSYSEANDLDRSLLNYYRNDIINDKSVQSKVESNKKNSLNSIIFSSKLETLFTSKIKLYFQYISNIDKKLKIFFKDLYEESDENTFILIITEISILLDILISKFQNNREIIDNFGFNYSYQIIENDVISRVFNNTNTIPVKILYQLGLQRIVGNDNIIQVLAKSEQKKENEKLEAIFLINSEYNSKHNLIKNYLKRLIKICKEKNTNS
jgi:Leucine-rich repeat (LRR) protein